MGILSACVSVRLVHAWCRRRPEGSVRSPGTGVIDDCEQLHGHPGPLEEQPVLLTT